MSAMCTGATKRSLWAAGLALLLAVTPLLACQTVGPRAATGAALGAASGGLIGAATSGGSEAVVAGVLLGGLLGGAVGDALDQNDRAYAGRTTYRALESSRSGQVATWRNPDTGHAGSVTPTRTFSDGYGGYCREYQQTLTVGGRTREAYGTACRQPDGSWRIVQ